jgi:hypothetical protein
VILRDQRIDCGRSVESREGGGIGDQRQGYKSQDGWETHLQVLRCVLDVDRNE